MVSALVRVALVVTPSMTLVVALASDTVPPPVRLAPVAAMSSSGVVRVEVRSITPERVTVALATTILAADRVTLLSASAPAAKSRVPAPVRVPPKASAAPLKII